MSDQKPQDASGENREVGMGRVMIWLATVALFMASTGLVFQSYQLGKRETLEYLRMVQAHQAETAIIMAGVPTSTRIMRSVPGVVGVPSTLHRATLGPNGVPVQTGLPMTQTGLTPAQQALIEARNSALGIQSVPNGVPSSTLLPTTGSTAPQVTAPTVLPVRHVVPVTTQQPAGRGFGLDSLKSFLQKRPSQSNVPEDFEWKQYLKLNPDLAAGGVDSKSAAELHYSSFGKAEGRPYLPGQQGVAAEPLELAPLPDDFVPEKYLELNPDLVEAGIADNAAATLHYRSSGRAEGRMYLDGVIISPDGRVYKIPEDFDWKTYLEINSDLAAELKTKAESEFHYGSFGRHEGRKYKYKMIKVKDASGKEISKLDSTNDAATSRRTTGPVVYTDGIETDDRGVPVDFDWKMYLELNPELPTRMGIDCENLAEAHFVISGRNEKRPYKIKQVLDALPADFDWQGYTDMNPDLKTIDSELKAQVHYYRSGVKEKRGYSFQKIMDELPEDFDWEKYLELNADLKRVGYNTEKKAKWHYWKSGKKENRKYKVAAQATVAPTTGAAAPASTPV